jgi:RNA polymerase sigma-70 factor, ECF subfamily
MRHRQHVRFGIEWRQLRIVREEQEGTADDEAALIVAAQQNPVAFADLYLRYQARIARYVQTQIAQPQDVEDLTQQIFLQALDALPRYRAHGVPFAAWLFRIARHAIIDAHRRRRTLLSWEDLPDGLLIAPMGDPAMIAEQRETMGHLHRLLGCLAPAKRELLALRFAAQLNSTQIASVVGKSPAAVKKQLTRILRELEEQYDEP